MKGKAIIFSAPSGAGKTTVVRHLISQIPELRFSISATTRAPRPNEQEGEDYYFLPRDAFMDKIEEGDVLEWEEVYADTYYGTLKSEVERIWAAGHPVIFDVDVKGGINLKRELGESALAIFLKVNDPETLKSRLKKRNTESERSLSERVNKAILEMNEEDKFDRVIVNEELEKALAEAESLVKNFIAN